MTDFAFIAGYLMRYKLLDPSRNVLVLLLAETGFKI